MSSVGEEMINPVPHRKGHDFRYAVDWSKLKNELGENGFFVIDIREEKIKNKIKNKILLFNALICYEILRFFFFDSFHLLLKKNQKE